MLAMRKFNSIILCIVLAGCLPSEPLEGKVSLNLSSAKITNAQVFKSGNDIAIKGTVVEKLNSSIRATCKDGTGSIIASKKASVEKYGLSRSSLHRGHGHGKGQFSIKIPYNDAIASCDLEIL